MAADTDAVDLRLSPNEASDLAALPTELLADEHDAAFVTVLDEGAAEVSLAALTHRRGASLQDGWDAVRLQTEPTAHGGKTEDAEACALRHGRLYVAGSQYGPKSGPLEPRRAWLARMSDRDAVDALGGARPALEVTRVPFGLHRAVNEALRDAGVDLAPLAEEVRRALVTAAVERGWKRDKAWRELVHPDDQPVNVEGMTFAADGTMLLGLRTPVSAGGDPLVVALPHPDRLFDAPDEVPSCGPVWVLRCGGAPDRPLGIRGLHTAADGIVHLVAGSLDSVDKDSVLVAAWPEAAEADCEHRHAVEPLPRSGGEVATAPFHAFPGLRTVEGLAQMPDGGFLYVVDRDQDVHLRFLLSEPG